MNAPTDQPAGKRDADLEPLPGAGYIVTNQMYNRLYQLYYQRCASQRVPCLVIVRNGSHCRLDLDMTCSLRELTPWALDRFKRVFSDVSEDDFYADEVYCWASRVPNRLAVPRAEEMLSVLKDNRALESA